MSDSAETATNAPLDEVMIAMDVVDTLRHDERIAVRELNNEARRAELIERLRALYKGQGIDVPDRILEQGVKALEQERFVYDPPKDDWRRTLAQIYVTRSDWGRWALAAVAGIVIIATAWYVMFERPKVQQAADLAVELDQKLPSELTALTSRIEAESKRPEVTARAKRLRDDGLRAAADGERAKARKAAGSLRDMLNELRAEFQIKIVQRRGRLSGLWRIPKVNPRARNYYLIVEAVRPGGAVLQRSIVNEETGKRERVKTWAIRVPKSVLDAVQADKADDGIIQNAIVGEKARGVLAPRWLIEISGGNLTRW